MAGVGHLKRICKDAFSVAGAVQETCSSEMLGNQRPDLLTSLMNMSLVLRLPRNYVCHRFWTCYKTFTFCSPLTRCTIPCACQAKRHLNLQISGPNPRCFEHLTSKCASRHYGVHFFDISTSKSGPELRCFVHFDFEMCFAPQRRALFRHLNFQKCSEPVRFLHF